MRSTVKKTIVASLAALTLGAAVIGAATPASAGGWGWHHYHHGFWGPGVAFGVLGLAAGAVAAAQYEGVRYQQISDSDGNNVGRRAFIV